MDYRDHKGLKERLVNRDLQVKLDHLASQDHHHSKEPEVNQVFLDNLDSQDSRDLLDNKDQGNSYFFSLMLVCSNRKLLH